MYKILWVMGTVYGSFLTKLTSRWHVDQESCGFYEALLLTSRAMKTQDFDFNLPEELIAQQPVEPRSASRLLRVQPEGSLVDGVFRDLLGWLQPGDLLVFNNTRVIPARLLGQKASGGNVEVMLERFLVDGDALVQIRANRSPKPGTILVFEGVKVECVGRDGVFFRVRLVSGQTFAGLPDLFQQHGHMPLPPYIQRPDTDTDHDRYQTIYAECDGAVAAPTAGLHFDTPLVKAIKDRGVQTGFTTLHVGAGTYQPVRVDNVADHKMHKERFEVSSTLADQVNQIRSNGGRVIAVGTTSLRAMETAWGPSGLQPMQGESDIFIYPGKTVHSADWLLTNFHLPQSTFTHAHQCVVRSVSGDARLRACNCPALSFFQLWRCHAIAQFKQGTPCSLRNLRKMVRHAAAALPFRAARLKRPRSCPLAPMAR